MLTSIYLFFMLLNDEHILQELYIGLIYIQQMLLKDEKDEVKIPCLEFNAKVSKLSILA